MAVDDDQLVRAVDRLVDHVGHWSPDRWARLGSTGERSRAEIMHDLVQRLADLEATATGRPDRPVPRLANDLALPDQVRVMVLDLLVAAPGPVLLGAALDAVTEVRCQL